MAIAVFNRAMTVNGRDYAPGYPVPEGVIPERRMNQLISLRRVVMVEESLTEGGVTVLDSTPPAVAPEPEITLFSPATGDVTATVASSEVTLGFVCSSPGCGKSFPTEVARNGHEMRMH